MESTSQILIIEDNIELATVLHQLVECLGFPSFYVCSGEEGLAILSSRKELPRAILCDLTLPDVNGRDILQHVLSSPLWSKVPFIAMSGRVEDKSVVLEMGAAGYLTKPFDVKELTSVLSTLM